MVRADSFSLILFFWMILELHVIDGIPQLIFVRASYTIEVLFHHYLFVFQTRIIIIEPLYWLYVCLSSQTVEAERISVDHVAHLKPSDGGSAATQCESSLFLPPHQHHMLIVWNKVMFIFGFTTLNLYTVAAHLTGTHSAIKMLNSRIRVLHHYLLAMQKGNMFKLLSIICSNKLTSIMP